MPAHSRWRERRSLPSDTLNCPWCRRDTDATYRTREATWNDPSRHGRRKDHATLPLWFGCVSFNQRWMAPWVSGALTRRGLLEWYRRRSLKAWQIFDVETSGVVTIPCFFPSHFATKTLCPFSMIVSIRFRSLRYDVPLRRFGALDSVLAALWMMDNSFYTYLGFALSLASLAHQ